LLLPPTHWLLGSNTVEDSRGTSRVVARAFVALGVCVLWLFIEAAGNQALCGKSNTRAQAFVARPEKGNKIAPPDAMRDQSLLVSRVVETTIVEQRQTLERGREKIDTPADRLIPIQRSDAAQGKAAQPPQSAPAWERKQPLEYLEYGQEWDRAEVLACALTSSLRVLISLRAELEAARIVDPEVAQAAAAEVEQEQALKQERDRAEALGRELTSLRAELDTARIAGPQGVQPSEADIQQ